MVYVIFASQLHMLISMIQANPNLINQMGQTALRIKNDLEKLQKLQDLNVRIARS